MASPTVSPTPADYFLKLDGVPGESQDKLHANEIQLIDFSFGMENRGKAAAYGGGSKTVMSDMRCITHLDISYPKLKLACAKADAIGSAVLSCRKAGKTQLDYMKVTLTNVLVTSCKLTATTEDFPVVEFTLSFQKKQIEYRPQRPDGTLGAAMQFNWDLGAAKGS